MKTSIRFRLSAAICAAILFAGAVGFLSVTTHGQGQSGAHDTAKRAAEAAVKKAKELAEKCKELQARKPCDDAEAARAAADEAIRKAEEGETGQTKTTNGLRIGTSYDATPGPGYVGTFQIATNGLRIITFDTSVGRVKVNLPDDIRAGDTISGTVFNEPKGNTGEEKAKNQSVLNGYVVEIGHQKFPVSGEMLGPVKIDTPVNAQVGFTGSTLVGLYMGIDSIKPIARIPVDVYSVYMGIDAISPSTGRSLTTIRVSPPGNVITPDPKMTPDFVIPSLGQTGRPIVITGPFDGNSSNTTINAAAPRTNVQDFERNTENVSGGFGLLTESPREAVARNSGNVTGPIQITVKEGDKQTTGTYRNVGVNLTAPKTSLLKGEKTELRVEVSGLQGIKEPVPLTLESRGVITMEGGMYQPLTIQPSQVGADGGYSMTRGITGVQAGGWSATATVVTYSWSMDVKIEGENCIRHLRFNSATGDYTFNCAGCSSMMSDGTFMTREQFAVFSIAPIGRGTVTQTGCIITLEHNAPDRRVMATFDQCTKTGTATVDAPANKAKFTITDRNTTDNTCAMP